MLELLRLRVLRVDQVDDNRGRRRRWLRGRDGSGDRREQLVAEVGQVRIAAVALPDDGCEQIVDAPVEVGVLVFALALGGRRVLSLQAAVERLVDLTLNADDRVAGVARTLREDVVVANAAFVVVEADLGLGDRLLDLESGDHGTSRRRSSTSPGPG